jgi:hypothetical protein
MSDLLIHSMSEFAPLILGCLERAAVRNIAEIGAEFGGMSHQLADHCGKVGGALISIDPAPQDEFIAWTNECPNVHHIAQPSLEAMPGLADIDAWMLDGDHNYYTVFNELKIADEVSCHDGKPLLVILHDVSWPCARRDMYYAPERIPDEHRHPCSFDAGVTLGDDGSRTNRGMRGMGNFAWALEARGPRNGVLTAVEDFLAEANCDERPLGFANIPAVFGLGVLFDMTAEWAGDLTEMLAPYHDNPLIASLEVNRLRNYLAVIDWQDRQAAGEAR